ncbi:hypothetical protein N7G274_009859 [Stereocaulon virgatum]|uniref:Uncharacterized protein n=1 Tax=Stereocaulon virgatum TaxID=373712 RepID=A0ABR3ZW26_9LECA
MGSILSRTDNVVTAALNLSSQILIRLSTGFYTAHHTATCRNANGDCFLGYIKRAWQSVWGIASYSPSRAWIEETKLAAVPVRCIPVRQAKSLPSMRLQSPDQDTAVPNPTCPLNSESKGSPGSSAKVKVTVFGEKAPTQANLPPLKDLPMYPPGLKSFYDKVKALSSSNSAMEKAGKADVSIVRLEAIKKSASKSGWVAIPLKTNASSTPVQWQPTNRSKATVWVKSADVGQRVPRPAEAPKSHASSKSKPASKPAKTPKSLKSHNSVAASKPLDASIATEKNLDRTSTCPVRSTKPETKEASGKGSSKHRAALKERFYDRRFWVTTPSPTESKVDLSFPSSPAYCLSSPLSSSSSPTTSSSRSPATARSSSSQAQSLRPLSSPSSRKTLSSSSSKVTLQPPPHTSEPCAYEETFEESMRRSARGSSPPPSPYQQHVDSLIECRAELNTRKREHSQAAITLKKAQHTLDWMVRQGNYNTKYWRKLESAAAKKLRLTTNALRAARDCEVKWVNFIADYEKEAKIDKHKLVGWRRVVGAERWQALLPE